MAVIPTSDGALRNRPKKTALLAAQRIVADITSKGLQPGDVLPPEREMLVTLGIARGTLREALRLLEVHGVITLRSGPKGGPVVSSPGFHDLASTLALTMHLNNTPFSAIVGARQLVEPVLASEACDHMDDDAIEELSDCIDVMRSSMSDDDVFFNEDHRFHSLIANGSGNPLLGQIITSLGWISDGRALGVVYTIRRRNAIVKIHTSIFDAIAAGSRKNASAQMREHMDEYEQYLRKRFPEVLGRVIRWDGF